MRSRFVITIRRHQPQPPEPVSYAAWRRQARELVTVPTTMGERQWRDQFIKGHSPEEAARYATTYYTNTKVRPQGRR
jgi:hypothetical protein